MPEAELQRLRIAGRELDAALKKYYAKTGKKMDPMHVLDTKALNRIKKGDKLTTGDINFSAEGIGPVRRGGEAIRIKPNNEDYIHFIKGDARGWGVKYYKDRIKYLPNNKVDLSKGADYIPLDKLQHFDKKTCKWVDF